VFGDFFMEHISHGHNGQFFTPEPICDLMAQLNEPIGFGQRVLDCACGSGRILMAAAKINRNALFYGADVDRNCAMMCVINFCLNGMFGEVAWMNSLSNQFYGAWQVRPYPGTPACPGQGNPYIVAITEAESQIVLKLPEAVKCTDAIHCVSIPERHPERHPEFISGSGSNEQQPDLFDDLLSPVVTKQLTLF
jgi:hypothetical protein